MKVLIFIVFLYIILIKYISCKFIIFYSIQMFLILFLLLWLAIYKHPIFYVVIFLYTVLYYRKLKPLIVLYYLYNLYWDKTYYPRLGYKLFRHLDYPIKHNFHRLPDTPSLLLLNYPSDFI